MDKLTFEEFSEYYQVRRNPVVYNSPYESRLIGSTVEEMNYINNNVNRENVWTLIDNDINLIMSPGIHYQNIKGYFITNRPKVSNEKYVIKK